MNRLNATSERVAIQRQEHVIDYLKEQLQDANDGMSLRPAYEIQNELDIAEAKLKRPRSGACRIGESA